MFDMSELSDWISSNWFELASLVVQCAILVALVWYARETSRISRAFQEQAETLQRPSLGLEAAVHIRAQRESVGRRAIASCRRLVRWLQAPAGS